ncbi:hypothetical protein DJ564_26690 [Pseudomonas sp. 31-12]|nr:hypothetical protein DJ564_26690 [Pseudomonas sp. 31-12]
MHSPQNLWRGSLLPLDREAVPLPATAFVQLNRVGCVAAAAQPSGSKLPRHIKLADHKMPAPMCRQ